MEDKKDYQEHDIGHILNEAAKSIKSKRYGPPRTVFELARSLFYLYSRCSGNFDNPAHEEAIHMALHKIARIACGEYNIDNYIDACGYINLAGILYTQGDQNDVPDK